MQDIHNFTMMLARMTDGFDNDVRKVVHENYHYCSILVSWVLRI